MERAGHGVERVSHDPFAVFGRAPSRCVPKATIAPRNCGLADDAVVASRCGETSNVPAHVSISLRAPILHRHAYLAHGVDDTLGGQMHQRKPVVAITHVADCTNKERIPRHSKG